MRITIFFRHPRPKLDVFRHESGIHALAIVHVGDDADSDAEYMAEKVANLRIFPDESGKMNRSLLDVGGQILAISQFTLFGDCRKGRRPGFDQAASVEQAKYLYELFVEKLRALGIIVGCGRFRAETTDDWAVERFRSVFSAEWPDCVHLDAGGRAVPVRISAGPDFDVVRDDGRR